MSSITAAPVAGAPWGLALSQLAGVLLLPLVWLGVAAQVEAGLSGRRGVRLRQPARDLLRALRKSAMMRPRGLLAVVAALALAALAPIVGPTSPLAFHGDLAVLVGLLALYHHSRRGAEAPPCNALQLLALVAAVLAGTQVGLDALVASPRWIVATVCAAATSLALRVVAVDRPSDVVGHGLARYLDGVVAVALSGLFAALLLPPARGWPGVSVHLLVSLALAAVAGAFAARVARPRPAAQSLYFGGAALCEGLGVVLHLRGGE
ncbi:hypothetical protein OV203_17720 [Nannocystis sp. ILAH1]|uniref:hypothetical protein n=1 Tax=Nannocystis sp. ILAH1 TaxID=2996789 RepID=UPI002270E353|nr:hypothetical protein [Nannocystis sp. ILAH1]MCY0988979.1 hypothetical protein [Nannocystis sp. ILAH1]